MCRKIRTRPRVTKKPIRFCFMWIFGNFLCFFFQCNYCDFHLLHGKINSTFPKVTERKEPAKHRYLDGLRMPIVLLVVFRRISDLRVLKLLTITVAYHVDSI